MPGVQRGQKTLLDPLEPGFQMTVNCHLGAGDQTLVLRKSNFYGLEPSLQPLESGF